METCISQVSKKYSLTPHRVRSIIRKMESEPVRFFSGKPELSEYEAFSNFSPHSVVIDGKTYATTEHYFQAQKFVNTDPEWAEWVRQSPTPKTSKSRGGNRTHPIDPNWDEIKEDVMRVALRAKFTQSDRLYETLMSTGDRHLIEASPYDSYWGEGKNRKGKNRLGVLLEELRAELRVPKKKKHL